MEVVQILYDYISQKEQEKSVLLVQLKQYIEDIKEVVQIHNVLHDNCLQSYPYNTQSLSEECNIFGFHLKKRILLEWFCLMNMREPLLLIMKAITVL
jgi:hypothetical protein